MNIIPKAKKVRFHITLGGNDCFFLEDLYKYFNLEDVRELIKNGKLGEWLLNFTKEEAKQIVIELSQKENLDNISDLEIYQIFFPRRENETNYEYLLRFKDNKEIADIVCQKYYKNDIEIAIYCIENNLIKTPSDKAQQDEDNYYLTESDIIHLLQSNKNQEQACYKLQFLKGKSCLKEKKLFDRGEKIIISISKAGFSEATEYIKSEEFKILKGKNYALYRIKEKINSILKKDSLEFQDLEKNISKFDYWCNENRYLEEIETYKQLIAFIKELLIAIIKYRNDKEKALDYCIEDIKSKSNYSICFIGICILVKVYYWSSKKESKKLFETSKDFPISQFMLDNWKNVEEKKFEYKNLKLYNLCNTYEFKNFIKDYINYTIDYLEKNEQ